MQIIAGSSNPNLAINIAACLGFECIHAELTRFSDSELKVSIPGSINKEVILVQSTSAPVNDNLIELLLLIDIVKRAGAQRITAIIPYFGYARQDCTGYENESIAASVAIKMIEAAGVAEVITLDLHVSKMQHMFNIPIKNLKIHDIFLPIIQTYINLNNRNIVIVSPDAGAIPRAEYYASILGVRLFGINKTRRAGVVTVNNIEGDVNNKHCILIDDIVDRANTICLATEFLLSKGALSITALVTHGVFSDNAVWKIEKSALAHLYITDSISHSRLSKKISVLPAHKLFTDALDF